VALIALCLSVSSSQAINDDYQRALNTHHALQLHSLHSIHSSDIHFIATTFSQDSLEKIRLCLSSIQFSSDSLQQPKQLKLSYEQYVALLETYQSEPPIQALLSSLLSERQKTLIASGSFPLLKAIRSLGSDNLPFNSFCCHPILSGVSQMEIEMKSFDEENNDENENKQELYLTTMRLLDALSRIQQHRSAARNDIFGQEQEPEEESQDTLQIMCVIDEVFGKEEATTSDDENIIYQNQQISPQIRTALLVERLVPLLPHPPSPLTEHLVELCSKT
jgi:hypothetical protein